MENLDEAIEPEIKHDEKKEKNNNGKTIYNLDTSNILGKGSFGIVYKGIQKKGDKSIAVALKEIPQELVKDKLKIQALADEIYISSKLNEEDKDKKYLDFNGNENIAAFLDIADINDKKYLVYEFCNGGDLKRYLRYFKKFDEEMVQYIIRQVIRGLYHLHKRKIIHHDIKPENILVELCPGGDNPEETIKKVMTITDPKNRNLNKDKSIMKDEELKKILMKSKMKVTDFGLSRFKEEPNNQAEVSGSPLYIDPNLFVGDVDPLTVESEKVDIWALGVLAYELFFYNLPFQPFPPSIERLKISLEKGEYIIDFNKNEKVSKQFIRFLNICLQRPQKLRPLTDELLDNEFYVVDSCYFDYLTIDNYKKAKNYPPKLKEKYLKVEGKITMNIDDNRDLNAYFDEDE